MKNIKKIGTQCFIILYSEAKEILSLGGGSSVPLETSPQVILGAGTAKHIAVISSNTFHGLLPGQPSRNWTPTLPIHVPPRQNKSFPAHPGLSITALSEFLFYLSSHPRDSPPPPPKSALPSSSSLFSSWAPMTLSSGNFMTL